MIKRIFVVFLLSITTLVSAQQIPMYNQYHIAPRVYNPSYAGHIEGVDIAMVRNQKWGNYDEGFITNYLSASYLLKGEHGLGINLYSDYLGITSKLKAHLLYAYHLALNENKDMFLRAGVGVGVIDNRIDFANAVVSNTFDPVLQNTGKERRTMFDMNVGINFQWRTLKVGVSVPQVLGTKLAYGDQSGSFYTLGRQFLGNVGYKFEFGEDKMKMNVRPEALVMFTPNAPFQYNAGVFFEMDKYFWIGGMYKSDYAVGINVGVNAIPNMRIGLAYDFQISSIAGFNSAPNAELMLTYNIPPQVKEVGTDNSDLVDSLIFVIDQKDLELRDKDIEINNKKQEIDSLNGDIAVKKGVIKDRDITIDSLLALLKNRPVVNTDTVEEKDPVDTGNVDVRPPENTIQVNPGDYFIELNKEDTPNGYYVICGAFAVKANADARIRKIKRTFPNARIIKNKRNDLFYVMVYHSTTKDEGLAYASYKANQLPDKDTWILSYEKPENYQENGNE
ncbi:PorP/SprF family type IX secretion system membrane protein [Paracrocinitomix mangrovi]|uniref:PorP/SprF family type IX secretion system membrane protein n=1 Tax=Paracrocinitomix mangrovi TaxID=2862509 RepID=UPI001C8E28C1|nr:PorP/SprF family type IX secretion system membrane protein [Paracrocinitomix mangrovi]UKN01757.1 PorP/SprF family type IX secretion system membrane protein [Paracrocinitomix mangrovi]